MAEDALAAFLFVRDTFLTAAGGCPATQEQKKRILRRAANERRDRATIRIPEPRRPGD